MERTRRLETDGQGPRPSTQSSSYCPITDQGSSCLLYTIPLQSACLSSCPTAVDSFASRCMHRTHSAPVFQPQFSATASCRPWAILLSIPSANSGRTTVQYSTKDTGTGTDRHAHARSEAQLAQQAGPPFERAETHTGTVKLGIGSRHHSWACDYSWAPGPLPPGLVIRQSRAVLAVKENTWHSAAISPLLPAARPRSRPPARCLPHSRRRLLPIDPEIHSPVASSSPGTSRISRLQRRPTAPEGTHSPSESQSQGSGPSADQACWSVGLSPILFCAAPSAPSFGRLCASVSRLRPSARPGPQQAPGLGTDPEPASGLRAARTTRYCRRTHSHIRAPYCTAHNGQPVTLTPPARRLLRVSSALPVPIPTERLAHRRSAFCAHLIAWELHIPSTSRCLARCIWRFSSDACRHPCHFS